MTHRDRRALILLDVDGVLNPAVVGEPGNPVPRLQLTADRTGLVRRLAALGTLVWASSNRAKQLHGLAYDIPLDAVPDQVTITPAGLLPSDPHFPGTTAKLHSVARWVRRQDPSYTTIVWIDDVLHEDAQLCANRIPAEVLLLRIDPIAGMQEDHVNRVENFIQRIHQSGPNHE